MRIALLIILLILPACGYHPIYQNMQLEDYSFKNITLEGDIEINSRIINSLSIKENLLKKELPSLFLKSSYKTEETSKDSRGVTDSYRSTLEVILKIIENEEIIRDKNFLISLNYSNNENKFNLIEYQNRIKSQLLDSIIEDVFLYLSTQ